MGISGAVVGFLSFDVRIAVVGAGISGLSAAYLLARSHSVTLYEQDARLGGHAHTHDVVIDGRTFPVDTGFMVFNTQTYPNFIRLLAELGVAEPAERHVLQRPLPAVRDRVLQRRDSTGCSRSGPDC